jgi:hypothetical protein
MPCVDDHLLNGHCGLFGGVGDGWHCGDWVEVWELGERKVERETAGLVERVEIEVGRRGGCEERRKWRG